MRQINRKLLRDFASHKAQVAGVILVAALGIFMFEGLLLTQTNLRSSIDTAYERTAYEDFRVRVASAPASALQPVADLENVKAVEGRQERDSIGKVDGSQLTMRVVSVPKDRLPLVNGLIVESGRYFEPGDGAVCLVEHHLGKQFGIDEGETVSLVKDGQAIPLEVTGTVVSPEYIRLASGTSDLVSDPSKFGVIFMPEDEVARIFGTDETFNSFVFTVKDKSMAKGTMEAAVAALSPYDVNGATLGEDEIGAYFLKFDISNLGKVSVFFSVMLLWVASLALYVTLTRMVFTQQRQIGVARALGYDSKTILYHYLAFGMVIGLAGGVLGVTGGYFLGRFNAYVYSTALKMPHLPGRTLDPAIMLLGLVLTLVFALPGALIPARNSSRMKPSEAMRVEAGLSLDYGDSRRSQERRRLFPSWLRFPLRNLSRNRKRTVLTCIGLIATVSALVAAGGAEDSIRSTIDRYLDGVIKWDAAAVYSQPQGAGTLESLGGMKGVERVEPLIQLPASMSTDSKSVDVEVFAYREDTEMHDSFPTRGSPQYPQPGEVLLNHTITKELPVETGDRVTFMTPVGALSMKVAGFVNEPMGVNCYANFDYLQGLAGGKVFNVAVARAAPGEADAVTDAFRSLPGVERVTSRREIRDIMDYVIGALRIMIGVIFLVILGIGFAIVFTMVIINVLERRQEVATTRTLGAGKGRIFITLAVETLAVALIAVLPGVALGWFSSWLLVTKIMVSKVVSVSAVYYSTTTVFLLLAFLVVVVLSVLPPSRQLWHLDLASVTKERSG